MILTKVNKGKIIYGTPIQKIPIYPPTESQMLFLSDGNTVVIKTQTQTL